MSSLSTMKDSGLISLFFLGTLIYKMDILSGRPWESLVGPSPWGHKESDMTEQLRHRLAIPTQCFFIKHFGF